MSRSRASVSAVAALAMSNAVESACSVGSSGLLVVVALRGRFVGPLRTVRPPVATLV